MWECTEVIGKYAILCKGLEQPQILVSVWGPGTSPPWIPRDNCICVWKISLSHGTLKILRIYTNVMRLHSFLKSEISFFLSSSLSELPQHPATPTPLLVALLNTSERKTPGICREADRVLVLRPGVRPEPLRWESQVRDIGPPETSRLHVISNGESSPRDLHLNAKTQLHSRTSKLQCWTPHAKQLARQKHNPTHEQRGCLKSY